MRKKSDLRGYQQRTITAFYESDVVQAVLPMGAGKTASALTAIRELIDDGVIRKAIVLAPKRVAQLVWPKEPLEWEHLKDTKVQLVAGTPWNRLKQLLDTDAEVYVVGIDLIKWLVDELKLLPPGHPLFDLLLIDELSRFKSPTSKLANKHLGRIIKRWKIRWGMTGTPRPNGYEDQFRPLQLLTDSHHFKPRAFDSWRTKHFMKVDADGKPSDYGYNWVIRPEHEAKIIRQIGSITFTVPPEEMPELPELVPLQHWVDLPPSVMKTYKDMENKLLAKFGNDPAILADNAAVATGKLAQIVQGFLYENEDQLRHLHSVKADQLVDMVEGLSGLPTLVAYEFVEDLQIMRELWPKLPFLGEGVSDKDAAKHEAAWNRGELPLLALHPASAGHGLNLQFGGSQMIWYGLTWSAELYDQTIKRFHRPGQTQRCFVHHIMARNTIDEVKYDRVHDKMTQQSAFSRYMRRV